MERSNILEGPSSYCSAIGTELGSWYDRCCKSKFDRDCLQVSLCERTEMSSLDWAEDVSSWVDAISWDADARGAPCSGSAKTSVTEAGARFLCFSRHEGRGRGLAEREERWLDDIYNVQPRQQQNTNLVLLPWHHITCSRLPLHSDYRVCWGPSESGWRWNDHVPGTSRIEMLTRHSYENYLVH